MQFTFDDHTLDTERRELLRGGAWSRKCSTCWSI